MNSFSCFLADIPVLDWKGPEFLGFYLVVFLILSIWCVIRAKRSMRAFEVRHAPVASLQDPYEIAFLAGGPPRVAQLALVRLVGMDAIRWKNGFLGSKVVPRMQTVPTGLNSLEQSLFREIVSNGSGGMSVGKVPEIISPSLPAIESQLAMLGLRPTAAERSKVGKKAAAPLLLLILLGMIKVGIGSYRDKPVVFLIILLVLTVVVFFVIVSSAPRLTEAGKRILEDARGIWPAVSKRRPVLPGHAPLSDVSHATAVMGPAVLMGLVAYEGMEKALAIHLGGASGGTTGGCSSGCGGAGGSGCGGGGCGGCGGGGD